VAARMAGIVDRLTAAWAGLTTKASAAGDVIAVHSVGQPQWTPRNYRHLADEGYCQNVVVFRCVQIIARSLASLSLLATAGERELAPDHPLLQLLRRPNPLTSGPRFIESVAAFAMIHGNAYIEAVGPRGSGPPRELWVHRPDRMKVVPRDDGMIGAYRFEANGQWREWSVDPLTNRSDILHLKDFHPLNDWYGFGGIEAASRAIDQHNAAVSLNTAMLQNGIVPAGALVGKNLQGKSVNELDAIRAKISQRFAGTNNAGRLVMLPGEWEWMQLGQNLNDMQWTEGMMEATRQICAGWGIPHVLIVPGEATYNNRTDARLELFENVILPLADMMLADLNWWLAARFGANVTLAYDKDQIPALAPRRQIQSETVVKLFKADIINLNEARLSLQYAEVEGGEQFYSERIPRAQLSVQEDFGELVSQQPDPPAIANDRQRLLGHETRAMDADEYLAALDHGVLAAAMGPVLREILRHFGRRAMEQVGRKPEFDLRSTEVVDFMRRYEADRIDQLVGATTRQELADAIAEVAEGGSTFPRLRDAVRLVFLHAAEHRSRAIARTETTRAANFATFTAGRQAGIERKQWLATRDDRARDSHAALDLQVRPMTEPFEAGSGAQGQYPGGLGSAPESVGCRCHVWLVADAPLLDADPHWRSFDNERELWERELARATHEGFLQQELRMVARLRRFVSP
jgi:HK97 family phage portal protein